MKKFIKNNIIGFILGLIVAGSIAGVVAYNYNAKDVGFNPSDSKWKVTNVKDALNDLKEQKGGDIIWTNPNPTTSFSAQTLNLDLTKYNSVLIVADIGAPDGIVSTLGCTRINIGSSGTLKILYRTTDRSYVERDIQVDEDKIVIGRGWDVVNNTRQNYGANNLGIPTMIIGIK